MFSSNTLYALTSVFLAGIMKANAASVYYCVNNNFNTPCHLSPLITTGGECHDLTGGVASFNDAISAFGPDSGLSCNLYTDFGCLGSVLNDVRSPGFAFLDQTPDGGAFNDDISSYKCFFV